MTIEIRACDDWVAVYKDGHAVEENHSVSIVRGLEALGIEFEYRYFDEDEMDDDLGQLRDGTDPFPPDLP